MLRTVQEFGLEPPLLIMVTMLGVRGCAIRPKDWVELDQLHTIDRDTASLPDVLIDTFECDVNAVIKPILDAAWNASGWPGSGSYDESGAWRGPA